MPNFDIAYKFTEQMEGGWSDVKEDRGGLTAWGISSKAHPEFFEGEPTKEKAIEIYRNDYWLANKCDQFNHNIPAVWLFDVSVNSGRTGVKHFQMAIGADIDGVIGPQSIQAADKMQLVDINHQACRVRQNFHRQLAAGEPSQKKFLRGWLNRAELCYKYCTELL